MKLYSLFCLILLSFSLQAQTYVRNYEAKTVNKKVGYTTATKTVTGDITQYEIESQIVVKILFTIKFEFKSQSSYKNGLLISSSASVYINDDLQSSVLTERVNDYYKIITDEHETKIYEDINWSVSKMYFNEPSGIKSVYSESEGYMKNMVKTSDGKYKVKDPHNENNSTIYSYSSSQGVYDIEVIKQHLPDLMLKQVREITKSEDSED